MTLDEIEWTTVSNYKHWITHKRSQLFTFKDELCYLIEWPKVGSDNFHIMAKKYYSAGGGPALAYIPKDDLFYLNCVFLEAKPITPEVNHEHTEPTEGGV